MDQQTQQYSVTTDEIMDFLKKNMVMKEDFEARLAAFEIKIDDKLEKQKHELFEYLDKKLSEVKLELKGDIRSLIQVLEEKEVITQSEATKLVQLHSVPAA
ncbi:MAG: hypothetical protein AAB870_02635 [Patescibacteria group bacterium]